MIVDAFQTLTSEIVEEECELQLLSIIFKKLATRDFQQIK